MKVSEIWRFSNFGIETFLSSVKFFYCHITLLIVSLIPSTIRAFQMMNQNLPLWLEGVVGITRIFLFLLIVSFLGNIHIRELKHKDFWEKFAQTCSIQFKKSWPHGFFAQICVFIVLLYGLGNLLIILMSKIFILLLGAFEIYGSDTTALYNASVYFLKNMSVIPLSIVYILYMCGARPINKGQ